MSDKGERDGRTCGGYELARTGKQQTQIAIEVGVSKVTVHQWISGAKRPGPPMRAKIRTLYGIGEERWDERYVPRASSAPPRSERREAEPDEATGGAFQMARSLQRQAQAQLDELEDEGLDWTPAEKAQVMQRLASTVNVLAKLTGQYEMGRRMLMLPLWKQLEHEMFEALRSYPEASRAVADRLEAFERTWVRAVG